MTFPLVLDKVVHRSEYVKIVMTEVAQTPNPDNQQTLNSGVVLF